MKKPQTSWALYDWANSAFATSVIAGFFPAFFQQYWSIDSDPSMTTARLGFLTSAAGLTVAILAPFLGSVADVYQNKKGFLKAFMALGVTATAGLYFVEQGQWEWAAGFYLFAFIGFYGANIFYDSLLPAVAGSDSPEYVSSYGYALGYLGGGILLALQVVALKIFGSQFEASLIVRYCFLSVSIWWLIFTLPLLFKVQEPKETIHKERGLKEKLSESLLELKQTLREVVFENKVVLLFLIAYWLYIDGVYTVVGMAINFGITLGFATDDLIAALLLTQFIGFPATWFFGRMSIQKNPRLLIILGIGIYCLVTIWALFMSHVGEFFVLAAIIGLVQGPVQSLSRGLFSHYIPPGRSAQYFGLFNLVGKFAAVLGPLLVGLGSYLAGSSKIGLVSLLVLFIPGAFLLWISDKKTKGLSA